MASIFQFSGQLATFNLNNSGCYRCLFPEAPTAELIPNCAQAGVLGVLPGIVANLAALEVVKVILELEGTLQNQLLSFEGLLYELKKFPYQKNKNCLCQKSSFDLKKLHQAKPATNTQAEDFEIDLTSFNRMRSNNPDLVILDVREEWERLINKIENSLHQPLDQLDQLDLTPLKNKTIVCYCAKGGRSKIAALALKKKGLKNTLSLAGGINSIFL
jgi:adenylyltransferase/sulfurtransferase